MNNNINMNKILNKIVAVAPLLKDKARLFLKLKMSFLIISVALMSLMICLVYRCTACEVTLLPVHLLQFRNSPEYKVSESGFELEINLGVNSGFTDSAYLMVYVEKEKKCDSRPYHL